MNQLTPDFTTLKNFWWSLPTSVQNVVKKLVPDQDTWSLTVTKTSSGDWVFSLPKFLTFNESLTGGTELVLDYYGEQVLGYVPCMGEKLVLTVSSNPLPEETLHLNFSEPDPLWPESSYYSDPNTGMVSWLCPYLQVLFKGVPDKLYVKLEPVT